MTNLYVWWQKIHDIYNMTHDKSDNTVTTEVGSISAPSSCIILLNICSNWFQVADSPCQDLAIRDEPMWWSSHSQYALDHRNTLEPGTNFLHGTFRVQDSNFSFFEGSGIRYLVSIWFFTGFWLSKLGANLKPEFVVPIRDLADLSDDLHQYSSSILKNMMTILNIPHLEVRLILKSTQSGTICKPSILSKLARKVGVKVEGKCSATSKQKDQSNLARKQDERVLVASSSIASVDEIVTMANHSMSSIFSQGSTGPAFSIGSMVVPNLPVPLGPWSLSGYLASHRTPWQSLVLQTVSGGMAGQI